MNNASTYIFKSPLSLLRISANEESITEICFLDDSEKFISRDIESETSYLLRECCKELAAFFNGSTFTFSVPVMQEGTAFQQKVWSELQKIPYGKTISYLELSKRIGDVKAIRAVGTSNGKNKIAIIVPCHRVIGTNGSLTGYAGGLGRKSWLLEHEMKMMHGVQTLF